MVELDRLRWVDKTDFLTICLVSSIGLGNLFQFPLSVYKHGTGAFLVVYLASLLVAGTPLFMLEALLGQFSSCGPLHVFACFPMARGLGLSMLLVALVRTVQAAVVLAQVILYCYSSFKSRMPWMDCDVSWGADLETCFIRSAGVRLCSAGRALLVKNATKELLFGVPLVIDNRTIIVPYDGFSSEMHGCLEAIEASPRQFYFRRILAVSKDITGIFEYNTDLVIAYSIVWVMVYFATTNIRFCARMVYAFAPSPFVIMLAVCWFALSLDNAWSGIVYMVSIDTSRLSDVTVWHRAVSSMLTSLGIGTGSVFVLASFNEIVAPIRRDVVYIVLLDLLASVVGSVLLFLVLGHLASNSKIPIEEFFTGEGAAMLFIMSSELLGGLQYPHLWSVIFYFTILFIGVYHVMAGTVTVITCVTDECLGLRHAGHIVAGVFCTTAFCIGLPLCSKAGYHLYQLVSRFAVEMPVLILACFEVMALTWGYGIDRLLFDISFMDRTNEALRDYWVFCWKYASPLTLLTALAGTLAAFQKHTEELFRLNVLAKISGSGLLLGALVWVPIYLVLWLVENGFDVALSQLPCAHWGPREPQQFRAYHEAIKRSDLPAQKKVYRTDRKETVAERFTLYLVHHSPKYMGRFIHVRRPDATQPPKEARPYRDVYPCE